MPALFAAGHEIVSGRVFRRIPNRLNRFNYTLGVPRVGAFRSQHDDHGALSVLVELLISADAVLGVMAQHPSYCEHGLCALDVQAVKAATNGRVACVFDPDEAAFLGHAHAVLTACDDETVQGILVELAQMIRAPVAP